jgi:hypothetical protein
VNIQPFQLIILSIMIILLVSAWQLFKRGKFKLSILVIVITLFLPPLLPIKFKQEGGSKLERSVNRFDDVPERIETQPNGLAGHDSFRDRQQYEMNSFDNRLGEIENEIHN